MAGKVLGIMPRNCTLLGIMPSKVQICSPEMAHCWASCPAKCQCQAELARCWASCPVTHGGCRQSAACYWAWCPAMHQVSADSTLLGIMPSNGPMYFFLWCTMSHYFKICDFGNPFDKNECHELFRGPFKIQISVSIDVRMQTNENEQVFLTLSRFLRTLLDVPLGRNLQWQKIKILCEKEIILWTESKKVNKCTVIKIALHCEKYYTVKNVLW